MTCAYCRQPVSTPTMWIESRPHKVIKLDGSIVEGSSTIAVCDPCHRRLPVDRGPA